MATDWWSNIQEKLGFLNEFTIALVVFLLGLVVGRLLGNLVRRLLLELEVNSIFRKTTGKTFDIARNSGRLVNFIVSFFGALIALTVLGLTGPLAKLAAAALLVLIAAGVLLGVKDYIPNLIAGFYIQKKKIFEEGDYVETEQVRGRVKKIYLTETEIDSKGDIIFAPNSLFVRKTVKVRKS
jgi:small-conductance mechanosensitive channel